MTLAPSCLFQLYVMSNWKRLKGAMSLRSFCPGTAVLLYQTVHKHTFQTNNKIKNFWHGKKYFQSILQRLKCSCDDSQPHPKSVLISLAYLGMFSV